MWLLVLLACVRTVRVVTDPVPAQLTAAGAPLGTGPVDVRVRWLEPVEIEATMVGYRPLNTVLRARPLRPASTVELHLERDRPPLQ